MSALFHLAALFLIIIGIGSLSAAVYDLITRWLS